MKDKTSEDALREAKLLYQTIYEQSPDGILLIDADGSIVEFNEAAHRQLGYTRDEFARLLISDINPFEGPLEVRNMIGAIAEKGHAEFDVKHSTKDGDVRDVRVIVKAIRLSGRVVLHAIWHDATEQQRALTRVADEKAWTDSIMAAMGDGISVQDTEFRVLYQNRIHEDLIGKHLGEYCYMGYERRKEMCEACPVALSFRDGQIHRTERNVAFQEGMRYFEITASPLRDSAGRIIAGIEVVREISDRRRAEERLKESEERFRNLTAAAFEGIIISENGRILDVNDQFSVMIGYERDELVGREILTLVSPESRPAVAEAIRTGREAPYEHRVLRRDGTVFEGEAQARMISLSGRRVRVAALRDITERKRAEEALRKSEERYRELVENASSIILEWDTKGRVTFFNEFAQRFFGYPEGDILGRHVVGTIVPETESSGRDLGRMITEICGDPERFAVNENENICRDGRRVWISWRNKALFDEEGSLAGILSIGQDITEKKLATDTLLRSEEYIRNIIDNVDEGLLLIDREFRVTTANRAYCKAVGISQQDAVGRHCYEISHNSEVPCYEKGEDCAVRNAFETGAPSMCIHKHGLSASRSHAVYHEMKAFPMRDGSGSVIKAIQTVRNITERYLLEEERLKTQKLEAIGTLAGGIAHDFNNLLQGVFGYLSMARMNMPKEGKAYSMLEQAEKALDMATNLTNQLLTFAKGGSPIRKPLSLDAVIRDAVRFALSGSGADCRVFIEAGLSNVEADAGQISQVIQNIVINASESMPDGGVITVAARNRTLAPPDLPAEKYVEIAVHDTGIGIPEEHLAKIFDPYFTTKQKGSGLGLATSYSIVRNHNGAMEVKSRLGKGSTFLVYLPAVNSEKTPEPSTSPAAAPACTGRVLLMDDDEIVREVAREMLGIMGYGVLTASDGEEAVRKYRESLESEDPFDVVILDLTVRGGMGGEEANRRLLDIDPRAKTVVSSGYSDEAVLSGYRNQGFQGCLKKPYRIDELRDILSSLLGS